MSSLRRMPVPGEIIDPKHESACLDEACRVLDVREGSNRIVIIPITPRRSKGRIYFVGPRIMELTKILNEIDRYSLAILQGGVTRRADSTATDEDLDKKYLRRGQNISTPLSVRNVRKSIIYQIIKGPEDSKLLFDPQVRSERIAELAHKIGNETRTNKRTKKMISELLNQYWAGGSVPGALTPFSSEKGGRGKPRIQKNKLGRFNALTSQNQKDYEGMVMSEKDKDICGFSWRNFYIRGTTIAKALRRMWREFYSTVEIGNDGKIHYKLLPVHQRPTRPQFERWGIERSPGHESWKKQYSKFNLNRIGRVLFGSASDDVVSIGQRGSTDSTSVDIEFVRVSNRTERIGPAHRILFVDAMYGYISGFYLGLNPPCTETVKLAYLHSLTDKREWLKWLGLDDQDPDNWIPIRFANILADNTDARCEGVMESFNQIGTGIKFVGVARSDQNSPVETSHHILHRMVDHNLAGTTHGQRHERGEERADILARHTIIEAIRETARAIYTHNTIELDIRPTLEMRCELIDKGLKLTRANLTRWKINQGKVAISLIDHEEARILLLPSIGGVFTQHGVKLLRPDTGQKREFIEPIQYISRHPHIIERILKAKVGRRGVSADSFDDNFLHDPYRPSKIFFRNPIDGELIPLDIVTKDEDIPFECSLPDLIDFMKSDSAYMFNARNSREESLSRMEERQEATKNEASDEYDKDLNELDKPPSKSAIHRNKKENRVKEKSTYLYGAPIQTPPYVQDTNIYSEKDDTSCDEFPPEHNNSAPLRKDKPLTKQDQQLQNSLLHQAIFKRRQERENYER